MKNRFTIREARDLTGYDTIYMIDYLVRTDIIQPSIPGPRGRGNKRYFNFTDLVKLRMIRKILDQKISVKKLKKAIEKSKELKILTATEHGVFTGLNLVKYMISDGKNIYFRKLPDEVIDLTMNGQMAFSFMLDVSQIHQELKNKVPQEPKKEKIRKS